MVSDKKARTHEAEAMTTHAFGPLWREVKKGKIKKCLAATTHAFPPPRFPDACSRDCLEPSHGPREWCPSKMEEERRPTQ